MVHLLLPSGDPFTAALERKKKEAQMSDAPQAMPQAVLELIHGYYAGLVKAGFTEAQAMELTKEFQRISVEAAMKQGK